MSTVDFKALIAAEIPAVSSVAQHLYHNGRLLADSAKTLGEYGVAEGDMIVLHTRGSSSSSGSPGAASGQQQQQAGAIRRQSGMDSEMIRLQVLGDPRLMNELRNSQPELAAAANDPEKFGEVFQLMERQRAEAEKQKQREIQMLNDDPFNIDAQRKIEELIRQEAVMENLQNALEHNPEAFGRVTMLYIPVEVNGTKVKAFVDSGAQETIMSPSCAETCGIMRLVDSRFAGIARGVGTAKILGRVHWAQIKIGSLFLVCSFTVMEGKGVGLLLGLDMLKRHQAVLDFKKGCLVIQDEEVQFLGESEIPKHDDDRGLEDEPTAEGSDGSKVGGRTGASIEPSITSTSAGFGPPSGDSSGAAPEQLESQHSAEAISQLEGLGFSRSQALAALNATGGDIDMAASLLFQ
ncbi:unnamed protein product [Tuber melanosporum]|uniref:DNA damage-inducible protein 1 n=1 Tax=Tuber melanosporum (strain Mel28) TaxID=656061 RepID=D5G787_TUBMM|nr:uncharacterized protein GSTUM_00002513001 [Tuber melanosporum]CAZ80380.1 unnamed protein product [Tuber melanosporum]